MPRRLLRDGRVVDDDWSYAGEVENNTAPALILTLAQWQNERDAWMSRGGRLGIVLQPAHPVELMTPDISRFALIAADFSGPGRSQKPKLESQGGGAVALAQLAHEGRNVRIW